MVGHAPPSRLYGGSIMKKKIFLILIFLLIASTFVFADNVSTEVFAGRGAKSEVRIRSGLEYFNGVFSFYLQIIVGIVGGALMAFRFTIEVVHALIMTESSNSPGELRKVVVRFFLHLSFAMFGAIGVLSIMGGATSLSLAGKQTSTTTMSLTPALGTSSITLEKPNTTQTNTNTMGLTSALGTSSITLEDPIVFQNNSRGKKQ